MVAPNEVHVLQGRGLAESTWPMDSEEAAALARDGSWWENVREHASQGALALAKVLSPRKSKANWDTPLNWKVNAHRGEELQDLPSLLRRPTSPQKGCGGCEGVSDFTSNKGRDARRHAKEETEHNHGPVAFRSHLAPGCKFGAASLAAAEFAAWREASGVDASEDQHVQQVVPLRSASSERRTLDDCCSVSSDEGLTEEFRSVLLQDVGRSHLGVSRGFHIAPAKFTHPATSEAETLAWHTPVDVRLRPCHRSGERVTIHHELLGQGSEVILQVYDLAGWTRVSNLPIFHLAVQVGRVEYFFSYRGIQSCPPGQNTGHVFKQSRHVGRTHMNLRECRAVLHKLRQDWLPQSYSILGRNCQSFAIAFCDALGLPGCVPLEYNRFSILEEFRTQVAGVFDDAATLLPRAPDPILQGCSMPTTLSDMHTCGHAWDGPSTRTPTGARPLNRRLHEVKTPTSPEPEEPEEPVSPMKRCFDEDILPVARILAGVF